jgi:predicted Zn finger-like uncharacterized protein
MFTVCPKCALTLVVTAADLRVAQGYVRCGRCSNVFNALARLSEDRQTAVAAAQAAAKAGAAPAPAPSPPAAAPPQPPLDGIEAEGDDDEPIPEASLEFDAAATDVSKVFIEPPPNPEWTAATGSFKAIVLRNEDALQAESKPRGQATGAEANHGSATRGAADRHDAAGTPDTQNDIELDADFLSATAAMRKLRLGESAILPLNTDFGTAELKSLESNAPDIPSATGSYPIGPVSRRSGQTPQASPHARATAPTQSTRAGSRPQTTAEFKSVPEPSAAPEPRVAPRPQARSSETPFAFNMEPTTQASAALARARVAPSELEPSPAEAPSGSATWWSAGTGALVILLAMQIVNHYRNDLAANAQLNRPVTALYAALGVTLTPRWDLRAYDVRQLGASADAASSGQIMVRASVKNAARQAQPLPLLRITLQDRFGNRIAARDVAPQNYLPRALPASSFLSAGQRIDAEMAFVDPGSNAVGFEIDACLPVPAGGIACANDPAAR